MSKDPAFLFYSSDFLTGVSDLTFEERGQYITLLSIQHQKGHLTKKTVDISVPNVSADVMAKFKQDENGLFYNERLEVEAKKRSDHSEKQRKRAVDGWKKRRENESHGNATASTTALPLEDEDVIENRIRDKIDSKELFASIKSECPFESDKFEKIIINWCDEYPKDARKKLTGGVLRALVYDLHRQVQGDEEKACVVANYCTGNQSFYIKSNFSNGSTGKKHTGVKKSTDAELRIAAERNFGGQNRSGSGDG